MKQFFLHLTALIFLSCYSTKGQIINMTPNQYDFCSQVGITFTCPPPPANYYYEWQWEDWNQNWTNLFPGLVISLGTGNQISMSSTQFGVCGTIRLLLKETATGFEVANDSRFLISHTVASNTIPFQYTTEFNNCGNLMIPPPIDQYVNSGGNRWGMWFKNGVATGVTGYVSCDLQDSAWYEYKLKLDCGDTITTGLIYYPKPSPPVIIATGRTTLCTRDSVNLIVTSSTNIDKWFQNGVAIPGSNGKTSIKVAATGSYTMQSKYSIGSGLYCYTPSNAIPVTVNPGAFISGTDKFCSTDSVQLTCTTASSYQWKKNGVNISGASAQNIWVKATGNYTVSTTGLTCNVSPVKTVTKYLVPSGLTLTPAGSYSLCNGNATTVSISGNNITSWQWQRNSINMPGAISSSFNATKTGTYRCVITNQIGCSKTSSSVQISSLPVSTLPQKSIQLQPGSEGMDSYITCAWGNFGTNFGNAGTIEISNWYKFFRTSEHGYLQFDLSQIPDYSAISNATLSLFVDTIAQLNVYPFTPNSLYIERNTQAWGESTINWINPPDSTVFQSVAIPCSTISSSSFLTANITDLVRHWVSVPTERFGMKLQLEGSYQMTWLSIASSDTTAPNYRPKLTVTYYAADINASGPTNLCTGGSVQFSTNAGAYTYQWYKNGVAISGATAVNYTATADGDYHVVLTAASGCTARSLVKKVTVNGLPQINLTPAADSVSYCYGSPITLKADSLYGYTFQWKRNNANITGATFSSYSPTTTAWYSISTTSNCGINSEDSVYVIRINTTVPVISAGGPTTFCAGQNVVLNSTTYIGAVTQWYKNNVLTSTGTSYTATTAGAYNVIQTAIGCSKTSNTITVTVNCREGNFMTNEEVSMQVYPNPAGDELNILVEGKTNDQPATIRILDLTGRSVYSAQFANEEMQLSTQSLSGGTYLLQFEQEGRTIATGKIQIIR
ncbi:MAG: DNRLRE domain-containing protein [Bacteroidia bacterium]